jgi:hypothetical protein
LFDDGTLTYTRIVSEALSDQAKMFKTSAKKLQRTMRCRMIKARKSVWYRCSYFTGYESSDTAPDGVRGACGAGHHHCADSNLGQEEEDLKTSSLAQC